MNPGLDIVIPSYNRYDYLIKQLGSLAPQLNTQVKVTVLDNCSEDLRYCNIGNIYDFIKVVRHPFNIGLVGNILRSYEYSKSGYLWILSDDDPISSDVIARILGAMESNPDHIYLSFGVRGEGSLKEGENIYSSSEFVRNFSCVSTIGFISANIFNHSFIKNHIHQGYLFGRTLFPHVAIFFKALAEKKAISVTVLKGCVSWNPKENTYPSLQHMTFLNQFDLGMLLNKADEEIFRLFYIRTWGILFFKFAVRERVLWSKIKEMSVREILEFFIAIGKGIIGKFYRKITDTNNG